MWLLPPLTSTLPGLSPSPRSTCGWSPGARRSPSRSPRRPLAVLLLAGGPLQVLADALSRALSADPRWIALAAVAELLSFGGYIALFWLVGQRATPAAGPPRQRGDHARRRRRHPAAPHGGRRRRRADPVGDHQDRHRPAPRRPHAAHLPLAPLRRRSSPGSRSPARAIALGLGRLARPRGRRRRRLARRGRRDHRRPCSRSPPRRRERERAGRDRARRALLGSAVRDARGFVRRGDARLLGAPAWWAFDAAVLWATFHALGEPPALAVLAFAYFAGQVGNTIPMPGAVSGGMVGTLLAFGVAPDLALSAVLAYRAVAIWLPAPLGLAALGALRLADRPLGPRGRRGRGARRGHRRRAQPGVRRRVSVRSAVRLRGFGRRRTGTARSSMGSIGASSLQEHLPATAASVAVARAVMRGFAAELGVDVYGVELAVSEAVANAVVHDGGDDRAHRALVDAHARGRASATGATRDAPAVRRAASRSSGGSPTTSGSTTGWAGTRSRCASAAAGAASSSSRATWSASSRPSEREPRDAARQRGGVEQAREPRRCPHRRARGPRRGGCAASCAPSAAAPASSRSRAGRGRASLRAGARRSARDGGRSTSGRRRRASARPAPRPHQSCERQYARLCAQRAAGDAAQLQISYQRSPAAPSAASASR